MRPGRVVHVLVRIVFRFRDANRTWYWKSQQKSKCDTSDILAWSLKVQFHLLSLALHINETVEFLMQSVSVIDGKIRDCLDIRRVAVYSRMAIQSESRLSEELAAYKYLSIKNEVWNKFWQDQNNGSPPMSVFNWSSYVGVTITTQLSRGAVELAKSSVHQKKRTRYITYFPLQIYIVYSKTWNKSKRRISAGLPTLYIYTVVLFWKWSSTCNLNTVYYW